MRFPWQRRADEEHDRRVIAEKRLHDARAETPRVRALAESLRQLRNQGDGLASLIETNFRGGRG